VDVVLGDVRQTVVDDDRKIIDVEPTRGDVGRDEHLQLSLLERSERLHPRLLALGRHESRRSLYLPFIISNIIT
jgi:hypothetical protein